MKCEGIMVKILDNLPNSALQEAVDEEVSSDAVNSTPTSTIKKGKSKKPGEVNASKSTTFNL
jgi:hypothetical protein